MKRIRVFSGGNGAVNNAASASDSTGRDVSPLQSPPGDPGLVTLDARFGESAVKAFRSGASISSAASCWPPRMVPAPAGLFRRPFLPRALAVAVLMAGLACSSRPLGEVPTGAQADRRLLALGQQSLEDRDWETARTWFRQLLDSYPRSQFAGDARLGIADTYYNQRGAQNALLAATEYRDYLTFFPNHPRADYAQFQIAFGHFKRRRSADRDQEDTELAATEFEKLLELYPNSRYAQDAHVHLAECKNDLATSMLLKAEFYQDHRNWCRGAIPRLEQILTDYPDFDRLAEVRHRLGRALTECGREEEALVHYQKIVEEHSESPYTETARERIRQILART